MAMTLFLLFICTISVGFAEDGIIVPCILEDQANSISVKFVDVDGDDDLDIIFANAREQNRIYINVDGRGTFVDETNQRFPRERWPSTDIDVGDVNGDGYSDIIIANSGITGVQNRLLINDKRGFFKDETLKEDGSPYRLPVILDNSRSVRFVDVDGDGDLDIIVGNVAFPLTCTGQQNRILINDGEGFFVDETLGRDGFSYRFPIDKNSTRAIAIGDINGNGYLDIVLANRLDTRCPELDSPQNSIWINDGCGFFTDETHLRLPIDSDSTRSVGLGDVDMEMETWT